MMTTSACTWPGRIPGDPVHDRIIAYLTVDIQQSPVWTAELLHHINAVASGALPSWERPGNAYCLYVYPDHVEIEDDYGDAAGQNMRIPLATFTAAVQAWQRAITDGLKNRQEAHGKNTEE
ncbi:MAG: hypothetical protein H6938_07085 [Burkholderiales bacterium]|nr:hypothetical protein [Burkholderiales bacterium]